MLFSLAIARNNAAAGLFESGASSLRNQEYHYDVSNLEGDVQIDCLKGAKVVFKGIKTGHIYLNMNKITFKYADDKKATYTVKETLIDTEFRFAEDAKKAKIFNIAGYRHHLIGRATFVGRHDLLFKFPLPVSKQATGPNIDASNGFKLSTESNINMFNIINANDNSLFSYHASKPASMKSITASASTLISGEGVEVEGIYGTDKDAAITSTAPFVHAKEFYGQSGVVDFSGNFSIDHFTLKHSKLTFTNLDSINAFGSIDSALKVRRLTNKAVSFKLNLADLKEGDFDIIYAPNIDCSKVDMSTSIHYISFPFLYEDFYGETTCTSNKISIKITKHQAQPDFCITKDKNNNKCPAGTKVLTSTDEIKTINSQVHKAVSVFKIWCFKDFTDKVVIDMTLKTAVEFDGDMETVYLSDNSIKNLNVVVSRGLNVHYEGNEQKTSIMVLRVYEAGINQKFADLCTGLNTFQLWSLRADKSALPSNPNGKALIELHYPNSMVIKNGKYNANNAGEKACYGSMIFIEPLEATGKIVSDAPVIATASTETCNRIEIEAPSAQTNGFAEVSVHLTGEKHSLKMDENAKKIDITFDGELESLSAAEGAEITLKPKDGAKIATASINDKTTIKVSGKTTCDVYHVNYQTLHVVPSEIQVNTLVLDEGSAVIAEKNSIKLLNYSYIPSDLAILVAPETKIEQVNLICNLKDDDHISNKYASINDMVVISSADSVENVKFFANNKYYTDDVTYKFSNGDLYINAEEESKSKSNALMIGIIVGVAAAVVIVIIVIVVIIKKKKGGNKLNSTPLMTTE